MEQQQQGYIDKKDYLLEFQIRPNNKLGFNIQEEIAHSKLMALPTKRETKTKDMNQQQLNLVRKNQYIEEQKTAKLLEEHHRLERFLQFKFGRALRFQIRHILIFKF